MKGSPFILIGCAAALFLSCGSKEDFSKTAPVPQKVKIEKVQASPVEDTYEAIGTVRSKTISVLSSKVLGRIVSIPVREGDRVKAGQLLVEIDDREMKAQLQESRAGLKEAQYALDEIEKAIRAGVILFDPIFQGLALSLMAGEVASLFLSRMTVPVLYYLSERKKSLSVR